MTDQSNSGERIVRILLEWYVRDRDEGRILAPEAYLSRCATDSERAMLLDLIDTYSQLDEYIPNPIERPKQLGEYRLTGVIARGGMGVIYSALDSDHRDLAIKMLPESDFTDPTHKQRFAREMKLLSEINHPGIVRAFDSGSSDGHSYIVMERFSGGTLRDRLVDRRSSGMPLSDEEIQEHCLIIKDVAEAAAEAHLHGIIHRDIKPSNILFDHDGVAHLADFGLAHLQSDLTLTTEGRVLGTLSYLAPERLLGSGSYDQRVDVYSLGVTLYEAVTLTKPFHGTLPDILASIRHGAPSPSVFVGRSLDRRLVAILEKSLEYAPSGRYENMRAFAHDLESWSKGGSVSAAQGASRRRLRRHIRRHPMSWAICTFILLGILGAWQLQQTSVRDRVQTRIAAAKEASAQLDESLNFIDEIRDDDQSTGRHQWEAQLRSDNVNDALRAKTILHRETERVHRAHQDVLRELLSAHDQDPGSAETDDAFRRHLRRMASWFERQGFIDQAIQTWDRLARLPGEERPPFSSLTVHTEPSGATVRIWRYRWEDENSVVWQTEPVFEGREFSTPILEMELPMGSYVLDLVAPDSKCVIRYPVLLMSGEIHQTETLWLPPDDLIGEDWIYIPPGPFVAGGDSRAHQSEPRTARRVDGFFIKRHEEVLGEYREFLDDLKLRNQVCFEPIAKAAMRKITNRDAPIHVPRDSQWNNNGPAQKNFLSGHVGNFFRDEDAVHQISPWDAQHYVNWLNRRSQERGERWVYALPSSDQWEKAARGVDGRHYSWGNSFDWALTAGNLTPLVQKSGPEIHLIPGRFPTDCSPYGLLDVVGNVREICANKNDRGLILIRGGEESFIDPDEYRLASRRGAVDQELNWNFGIRLVRTLAP